MPRALIAPWDEMQAAYNKGIPLPKLAQQYNISYSAVRARAHRYNWRETAAQAATALQHSVTLTLHQRGEQWGSRVATLMERHLAHLESLDPSQLKLKELEMLARITDTTDKTARRTFGIDADNGGVARVQVNLMPPGVATKLLRDSVIDVDEAEKG